MTEDSYAWLEVNSPRTMAWQALQDKGAQAYIRGLPVFGPLGGILPRYQLTRLVELPRSAGPSWFRRSSEADSVEVAASPAGPWRPLPDLAADLERLPRRTLASIDEPAARLLGELLAIAAGRRPVPTTEKLPGLFTEACFRLPRRLEGYLARLPSLVGEAEVEAVYTWRPGWLTAILRSRNGSWWWATCGSDASGKRIALMSIVSAWGLFSPRWRLQDFVPSPSGSYVACVLAPGAPESPGPGQVRIIETASGTVLEDRVDAGPDPRMAWLADESGFYCNAPDPATAGIGLWHHSLGGDTRPVEPAPSPVEGWPVYPVVSDDGRWLGLATGAPRRIHYVRRCDGRARWIRFHPDVESDELGVFVGNRYLALDFEDAPRGRVVSIPVSRHASDRSHWRELIPENDAVLRSIARVGDRLILTVVEEGALALRIHSLRGTYQGRVSPPSPGTLSFTRPSTVRHESPLAAPALYEVDVETGCLTPLSESEQVLDDCRVERHRVPVSGGESIWIEVARRSDADGALPTLLYGYGYLNAMALPSWKPVVPVFARSGGAFVFMHLRGGGEYGVASWHHARAHRQETTVNDVYTVVEYLVSSGIADPERIAFGGASAAGLLAAIALTQRPELFRVVAPVVPLTDCLRLVQWMGPTPEFGSLDQPEERQELLSLSPYHLVEDGRRYPAVLVGCGADDANCPPWHGRKLVARLRDATAGTEPVLLRVWEGGHEVNDAVSGQSARGVEYLAFVMDRLGMMPDRGEGS